MATSDLNPRVPSVGQDPREQSSVVEPPQKTFFRELDEAVIEADRCIQCGTCVAACPSDSIGIDALEERPTLVRMCTGCSRCWDFCPRSGLRYEKLLSMQDSDRPQNVGGTYAARPHDSDTRAVGQDSGAVTALLAELIEEEYIDGALVARSSEASPLKGGAYLATSRSELLEAAGSYYNQTMQLGELDRQIAEADFEDPAIAIVGTPCVIQGVAALERYQWENEVSPIELTIALMCTRTFGWDRLEAQLASHGVDPTELARLDVTEGTLYGYDATGEVQLETPVDSFDGAALTGCAECADFLGGAADISAGNVGTPDGTTTMVIRTERGEAAWSIASDALAAEPIETPETLSRLDAWNQRRAQEALPRTFDSDGSLTISYESHRAAFDGTDRAPQPLNPARVYQYEEWC